MLAINTPSFLKFGHALAPLIWLGALGAACAGEPPAVPQVDRLPQPANRATLDLAQVARGYEATGAGPAGVFPGTRLLVFISLAMPEGALRRLLADGARSGAVLVLRGLEGGSMVKTADHIRQLASGRPGAIQIDPKAFTRYGIEQVPVTVLAREEGSANACQEAHCARPGSFVSVAGDVSIGFALAHIERTAPRFRTDAARLRGLLEP